MADNTTYTAGTGTTVGADDVGSGVLHQRVKITWGVDGTGNDVNASTPLPVQEVGGTTGGASNYTLSSAATSNAQNIKSSAGKVFGIDATNSNASPRYLRLYNTSSSPTVGTSTVFWQAMIPAGGGIAKDFGKGMAMGTGISISITANAVNTDTTSIGADECKVNVQYL